MQEEALERIRDYYVNLRRQAGAEAGERGPVPMTPRQLEAIVRLAESSARVRLSNEVRNQDVDRAITIVEYYLRKVSGGTGVMDIDVIATGISHDQRERINIITEIIRSLEVGRDGAPFAEVIAEAERRGIPVDKSRETVLRLKEQGRIYEPRSDHFRLTHS
jgi:replicative DNA helicase Mcm